MCSSLETNKMQWSQLFFFIIPIFFPSAFNNIFFYICWAKKKKKQHKKNFKLFSCCYIFCLWRCWDKSFAWWWRRRTIKTRLFSLFFFFPNRNFPFRNIILESQSRSGRNASNGIARPECGLSINKDFFWIFFCAHHKKNK